MNHFSYIIFYMKNPTHYTEIPSLPTHKYKNELIF